MAKKSRCWSGYEPTPGKKAYSKGSCQKSSGTKLSKPQSRAKKGK